MSANQTGYRVISQVHQSRLDRGTGEAVAGVEVRVWDNMTGQTVPVFVPEMYFTVEGVKQYVEAALETIRGVHTLGQ